jgi:signal transduction histidine kinase
MLKVAATKTSALARRIFANPHFWTLVALSAMLLFIYQAWPWRDWQFTTGFWSHFSWLSGLNSFVTNVELKLNIFGLLFFVPIIYGSLTLSWPGGIFAWLLSLVWLLPTLSHWSPRWMVSNLVLLLLPALLAAILAGERRSRESERRHYAENEQLGRAYVARLLQTQESERRRIAQEIHDQTLQTLLAIANKLDSLASSAAETPQKRGIGWARQKLMESMDDLRRLSVTLRPSILDNFGLVAGIRWLTDDSIDGDCRISTRVKGRAPETMSALSEATAFRVTQEAVVNIHRHSAAKTASVALEFDEDELHLEIQDDGVGFELPDRLTQYAANGRLGIIGMEERVLSIGGTIQMQSYPGRGTRIRATIPYSAPDQTLP